MKAIVEDEDNEVENGDGDDEDDSSDEDWGKNVEEEAVEEVEEVMDLDEEDEEEDVVKRSKWKGGEKGRLRKRKASEGEKLGSAKKKKEGFKFSLMEPTSNNAESKMEYYICMYFIGLFGDKMLG